MRALALALLTAPSRRSPARPPAAADPFGLTTSTSPSPTANGAEVTQAGSHPYQMNVSFAGHHQATHRRRGQRLESRSRTS